MSWIGIISYKNATGELKRLYKRVKGPKDNIDNILLAHSLRPHTLQGHMVLYKNVLHHNNNTLPKWYLETIGVYVSQLNGCDYCVEHHLEGLRKLLNNEELFNNIKLNLHSDSFCELFDNKYEKGLNYSKKLTCDASAVTEQDIIVMQESGLSDGEILEINQVTSYFNYANRTVLGLGIVSEGDILGLSPNDNSDSNNWTHK
jgi:uncharacterized peroxidase-related enzyme